MATTYPGAIDSLTNPVSTDPLSSPAHAGQHTNANDAIEAIEGTLGVNPQGAYATVAARMAVVDSAAASAAVSASAAAVSASAALVSQLDAAQSSSDAQEWAIKLIDPVSGSDYSSKYNANLSASSASAASVLYAQFDVRYLGAKSTPPTLDNQGNALIVGALYFDTPSVAMKVWTGSVWINAADSPYSWTGPISISASSASPALLITQIGSGDVLRVEDEAGDTSPFTISANGSILTYSSVTASASGRFSGHGAITQCTSTTRPGSPAEGDIIYETDTDLFFGWNGSAWTSIGGGGSSVAYQTTPPTASLSDGSLWVDSDGESTIVNANDYLTQVSASATYATKAELASAGYTPFLLMGA